jgi:mRNA interferase RelE/StbE
VSYEVRIKPSAVKELRTLQKQDRIRVVGRTQALAEDPRPPGCEKLPGSARHRARQGPMRVLYEVDDHDRIITVVKVGHRRDVYR